MASKDNIAPQVAPADTASGVAPSGPHPAVSISTTSATMPPVVAHGFTGDVTTGTTASGVPPGVSVSNNSGAAQPGVPPSVPGGMTVGATPSGVPPGVSASNNSRAAQPGVPPSVPGGMTVGATPFGGPPGVSASNNSGAAQPGIPPSVPGGMTVGATPFGGPPVPATAPVVATPSRIPGGTTSGATTVGPLNLQTANVTNDIPFNNEGQFRRPNGAVEYADDSGVDSDDDPEGDQIMKEVGDDDKLKLSEENQKNLLKGIAECSDPDTLVAKLEALLPEGKRMSLQQLQEILLPSRWGPEHQKEALSAQNNIQKAISAGKNPNWEHHHGGSNVSAPPVPKPHPFHKEAYKEATRYLHMIAHVIIKNPERGDIMRQAEAALKEINAKIMQLNQQSGLDTHTGTIDLTSIGSLWHAINSANSPEAKQASKRSLKSLCDLRGYPRAWRVFPPKHKESVPPQPVQPQSVPPQSVPPQSVPPQSVPPQSFPPQSVPPQSFPSQSVPPQSFPSQRAIEPGKTSTGEKICFVQKLGENRARFVVESSDHTRRLVESSDAGGFVAIEGARRAGVPETTRKETDILALRSRVRSGGIYGLTFVAVGEWDPTQKRLPFIVVGFYYSENEHVQAAEYAISKSNLGKILSPREAERLVVEGIVGHQSMSLREALSSQLTVDPWQSQSPHLHGVGQMQQPYLLFPQSLFNPPPDLQQNYFPQQLVPYVQQHATNLLPVQQQPYFPHPHIISQQALPQQAPVIPQQQQYYQQHPPAQRVTTFGKSSGIKTPSGNNLGPFSKLFYASEAILKQQPLGPARVEKTKQLHEYIKQMEREKSKLERHCSKLEKDRTIQFELTKLQTTMRSWSREYSLADETEIEKVPAAEKNMVIKQLEGYYVQSD
ncbi:hypothetical protein KXW40_005927 [Aspergillus fumigatus]|nr:hypothetical protein KXV97_009034 [Aspergillus fumigatus]KAH2527633.1 hypothetical protein KXW40_005927 [Aspergillus fumigatus]